MVLKLLCLLSAGVKALTTILPTTDCNLNLSQPITPDLLTGCQPCAAASISVCDLRSFSNCSVSISLVASVPITACISLSTVLSSITLLSAIREYTMINHLPPLIRQFISAQFLRYFVIGITAFVVDFGLFTILTEVVGFKAVIFVNIPNVISSIVGAMVTFGLNRWVTFGLKTKDQVVNQGLRFFMAWIIVFVWHQTTFTLLHNSFGLPAWFAKGAVMGVQMFVNFMVYKYVVFKVQTKS